MSPVTYAHYYRQVLGHQFVIDADLHLLLGYPIRQMQRKLEHR